MNPNAQPEFLQSDISLLKNVDEVCGKIAAREKRINLLFMTPGILTIRGRDETSEGLDRKLVLHFYARMRFITNMLPLLKAGAEEKDGLSRVVSVLDPLVSVRLGGSGTLNYSDLSLKDSFSLSNCGAHASLMNNFFLEGVAQQHPETSFLHAYPSGVATGLLRDLPAPRMTIPIVKFVLSKFLVPLEESGERHLYMATSPRFAPKIQAGNIQQNVATGSDGTNGSGCYWMNWDDETLPLNSKLIKTRDGGAVEKVMQHTDEVFERVCVEGKVYP
jgi:hypothetical protein